MISVVISRNFLGDDGQGYEVATFTFGLSFTDASGPISRKFLRDVLPRSSSMGRAMRWPRLV